MPQTFFLLETGKLEARFISRRKFCVLDIAAVKGRQQLTRKSHKSKEAHSKIRTSQPTGVRVKVDGMNLGAMVYLEIGPLKKTLINLSVMKGYLMSCF